MVLHKHRCCLCVTRLGIDIHYPTTSSMQLVYNIACVLQTLASTYSEKRLDGCMCSVHDNITVIGDWIWWSSTVTWSSKDRHTLQIASRMHVPCSCILPLPFLLLVIHGALEINLWIFNTCKCIRASHSFSPPLPVVHYVFLLLCVIQFDAKYMILRCTVNLISAGPLLIGVSQSDHLH